MSETESQASGACILLVSRATNTHIYPSVPQSPTLSNLPPLPPSLPTSAEPSDDNDDLYASDSSDDTEVPLDIPDMFTGGPLEPVHEEYHTQEEYYTQPEYTTPAFSTATSSAAPSIAPPSTSHFETPADVEMSETTALTSRARF